MITPTDHFPEHFNTERVLQFYLYLSLMKVSLRRDIHLLVTCVPSPFEQRHRTSSYKDEAHTKSYSKDTYLFIIAAVLAKMPLNRPLGLLARFKLVSIFFFPGTLP